MSSLKDEEPQLILCCDKSIPKISENEELESLRYQLKILKTQMLPQSLKNEREEQLAKLLEENTRYKQRLEKIHPLLLEKEASIASLQLLVQKFRDSSEYLRNEWQKSKAKEKELTEAAQRARSDTTPQTALVQAHQKETHQLKAELAKEKREKQQAVEEALELYAQFEILKKRVVEAESASTLVKEMETQLHQLENAKKEDEIRLQKSLEELAEAQERRVKSETARQEIEEQLKYAHQHLAKKVKETTGLSETLKKMEQQVEEALSTAWEAKAKSDELQEQIERYQKKEEFFEKQLRAAEQSAEVVAREAEEKCYTLYDALKKSESKLNELKMIEEKYQQLQTVWANINGSFDTKKPYQNLFDSHHSPIQTRSE